MSYSVEQRWTMFLGMLQNNASEDIRHAATLIDRDRYQEGMHDQDLRDRVEGGIYGSAVASLWSRMRDN